MRVLQLNIEQHRSVRGAALEVNGLVVVFGENSSGKTSLLEAAGWLLGHQSIDDDRTAQGTPFIDHPTGSIWLELDAMDVPGHLDAEFIDGLFAGRYGLGLESNHLTSDEREDLAAEGSAELTREFLLEKFLASSPPGSEAHRTLAEAVLRSPALMVDATDVWLVGMIPWLDEAAGRAAVAIAEADDPNCSLTSLARDLLNVNVVHIESLGDGYAETDLPLPKARWLRLDPTHIGSEVETALTAARDRLVNRQPLVSAVRDHWLLVEGAEPEDGTLKIVLGHHGEIIDPQPPNDARYVVDPVLHYLTAVLASRANEHLPSFVTNLGQVEISINHPGLWATAAGRTTIGLREADGVFRHVQTLGAGSRRWVAAAIRTACGDLDGAAWDFLGSAMHLPSRRARTAGDALDEEGWNSAMASLSDGGHLASELTPVWPAHVDEVLLVDEPEANLHPAAVGSVREWLITAAQRTSGVIVASHHPAFLQLDPGQGSLVHTRREHGKTVLTELSDAGLGALDEAAAAVGATRAEVLQLTRLFLFVEGPHDQIVLRTFVGDVLDREPMRLRPPPESLGTPRARGHGRRRRTSPAAVTSSAVARAVRRMRPPSPMPSTATTPTPEPRAGCRRH